MDDTISRQAAIDALRMDIDIIPYAKAREYARAVIETVYNRLEELPSAQQWIPCSERLPEEEKKHYWVCTDTGYQCECRWTNINHFWTDLTTDWHWHIMDIPQYSGVIAWMPLPEPYKERREE